MRVDVLPRAGLPETLKWTSPYQDSGQVIVSVVEGLAPSRATHYVIRLFCQLGNGDTSTQSLTVERNRSGINTDGGLAVFFMPVGSYGFRAEVVPVEQIS